MSISEIETAIIAALNNESGERHVVIKSEWFCLEDIREGWQLQPIIHAASILSKLVGQKVRAVKWDNTAHPETNPRGKLGRFVIELEPHE